MQPYVVPFLQFQPSRQGMFLIQLKFQATHLGAAGTIKIHMVSLSTTRWKTDGNDMLSNNIESPSSIYKEKKRQPECC